MLDFMHLLVTGVAEIAKPVVPIIFGHVENLELFVHNNKDLDQLFMLDVMLANITTFEADS